MPDHGLSMRWSQSVSFVFADFFIRNGVPAAHNAFLQHCRYVSTIALSSEFYPGREPLRIMNFSPTERVITSGGSGRSIFK